MVPPNNTTVFDDTVSQGTDDESQQQPEQQQQQHLQRKQQLDWEGPPAQGLYDPLNEHEACGVGFIVAIDGKRSHKVIDAPSKQNFINIKTFAEKLLLRIYLN